MCYNSTNNLTLNAVFQRKLKSKEFFLKQNFLRQVAETLIGVNASVALKYRSQGEGVIAELSYTP